MTENQQTDAGCSVDWAWLAGRRIVGAQSNLESITLTFDDGKTLVVRAGLYRGMPFLSFDPWRPGVVMAGQAPRRGFAIGLGIVVLAVGAFFGWGQLTAAFAPPRYPNPTPADGFHEYLVGDLGGGTEAALPELFYIATVTAFPDRFGHTRAEIFDRYGMIENPDTELPYGVSPVRNVLGQRFYQTTCALCHTGRVNGQLIHGLGNPNLSLTLLTRDIAQVVLSGDLTEGGLVDSARSYFQRSGETMPPHDDVLLRLTYRYLHDRLGREPEYTQLDVSPGRNGPVEYAKLRLDMGLDGPQAPVKFPAIWYWDRTRTRFTSDGAFIGDGRYLPLAPAYTGGREAKTIVRDLSPFLAVVTWAENAQPPAYPGTRRPELEARGRTVYDSTCASCHGGYDPGAVYPELLIPVAQVGTDRTRVDAITPELVRRYNQPAFAPYLRLEQTGAYLAPNLQGLWARAPYLHNGSVPTLADLLNPAADRPFFYTGHEPLYDLDRVGLACPAAVEDSRQGCASTRPAQFRYDTAVQGNSNVGHEFGAGLSDADKAALIAYLESL